VRLPAAGRLMWAHVQEQVLALAWHPGHPREPHGRGGWVCGWGWGWGDMMVLALPLMIGSPFPAPVKHVLCPCCMCVLHCNAATTKLLHCLQKHTHDLVCTHHIPLVLTSHT
jgi:hypothetical protein